MLTPEECALLKQSMFKGVSAELEPAYRRLADRDINSVTQTFFEQIREGVYEIGNLKTCTDVIRDNVKDYRGIMKAVGYDSPNQKFKDILAGKA